MGEEVLAAYNNGMGKGTAQGRLLGRLEAYQDIERLCRSIVEFIPRYESPQLIKQVLSHCSSRIAQLNQSPVASTKDNVEAMKKIADQLKEKRDGR